MSKPLQKQSTKPAMVVENSSHILFAGVICLVVGLAVGYYFGERSAESRVPFQSQGQSQIPVENPSAFLQEEATLKSTLRSNPKDLNTLIQLGNLYYDHRQFQEAVEYYGRALEMDPKNTNVRTDRGTSYWNIGQSDAAISEFKKSLEVDPTHAQTLYNLGVVYLDGKNDHEEARRTWERLLATNPNYPERAKVERQLTSLRSAGSSSGRDEKEPTSNVQDLMQRLKNH
jgi:cytochrome c-type biogenesis protein CcmH/NrfG